MHDLLQFLNIAESMATLTAWVSVFALLVDGKSICGESSTRTNLSFYQTWELTTVHCMDLYVGPPEKVHQRVWLEHLHGLPTLGMRDNR
jgi:hypothetical protein